jgi:hypothetical protein
MSVRADGTVRFNSLPQRSGVPKQPKSSLAGAGPVWCTRVGEKWARNASAIRWPPRHLD